MGSGASCATEHGILKENLFVTQSSTSDKAGRPYDSLSRQSSYIKNDANYYSTNSRTVKPRVRSLSGDRKTCSRSVQISDHPLQRYHSCSRASENTASSEIVLTDPKTSTRLFDELPEPILRSKMSSPSSSTKYKPPGNQQSLTKSNKSNIVLNVTESIEEKSSRIQRFHSTYRSHRKKRPSSPFMRFLNTSISEDNEQRKTNELNENNDSPSRFFSSLPRPKRSAKYSTTSSEKSSIISKRNPSDVVSNSSIIRPRSPTAFSITSAALTTVSSPLPSTGPNIVHSYPLKPDVKKTLKFRSRSQAFSVTSSKSSYSQQASDKSDTDTNSRRKRLKISATSEEDSVFNDSDMNKSVELSTTSKIKRHFSLLRLKRTKSTPQCSKSSLEPINGITSIDSPSQKSESTSAAKKPLSKSQSMSMNTNVQVEQEPIIIKSPPIHAFLVGKFSPKLGLDEISKLSENKSEEYLISEKLIERTRLKSLQSSDEIELQPVARSILMRSQETCLSPDKGDYKEIESNTTCLNGDNILTSGNILNSEKHEIKEEITYEVAHLPQKSLPSTATISNTKFSKVKPMPPPRLSQLNAATSPPNTLVDNILPVLHQEVNAEESPKKFTFNVEQSSPVLIMCSDLQSLQEQIILPKKDVLQSESTPPNIIHVPKPILIRPSKIPIVSKPAVSKISTINSPVKDGSLPSLFRTPSRSQSFSAIETDQNQKQKMNTNIIPEPIECNKTPKMSSISVTHDYEEEVCSKTEDTSERQSTSSVESIPKELSSKCIRVNPNSTLRRSSPVTSIQSDNYANSQKQTSSFTGVSQSYSVNSQISPSHVKSLNRKFTKRQISKSPDAPFILKNTPIADSNNIPLQSSNSNSTNFVQHPTITNEMNMTQSLFSGVPIIRRKKSFSKSVNTSDQLSELKTKNTSYQNSLPIHYVQTSIQNESHLSNNQTILPCTKSVPTSPTVSQSLLDSQMNPIYGIPQTHAKNHTGQSVFLKPLPVTNDHPEPLSSIFSMNNAVSIPYPVEDKDNTLRRLLRRFLTQSLPTSKPVLNALCSAGLLSIQAADSALLRPDGSPRIRHIVDRMQFSRSGFINFTRELVQLMQLRSLTVPTQFLASLTDLISCVIELVDLFVETYTDDNPSISIITDNNNDQSSMPDSLWDLGETLRNTVDALYGKDGGVTRKQATVLSTSSVSAGNTDSLPRRNASSAGKIFGVEILYRLSVQSPSRLSDSLGSSGNNYGVPIERIAPSFRICESEHAKHYTTVFGLELSGMKMPNKFWYKLSHLCGKYNNIVGISLAGCNLSLDDLTSLLYQGGNSSSTTSLLLLNLRLNTSVTQLTHMKSLSGSNTPPSSPSPPSTSPPTFILQPSLLPSLRYLCLACCSFNPVTVLPSALPLLQRLYGLDMSYNDLSSTSIPLFNRLVTLPRLRMLRLRSTELTSNHLDLLFESLVGDTSKRTASVHRLETLDLSGNVFTRLNINNLAAGLAASSCLIELSIEQTNVVANDCSILAKALLMNRSLEVIDLSGNCLEDAGANHLAEVVRNKRSLRELVINRCSLGLEGIEAILKASAESTSRVSYIRLAGNTPFTRNQYEQTLKNQLHQLTSLHKKIVI